MKKIKISKTFQIIALILVVIVSACKSEKTEDKFASDNNNHPKLIITKNGVEQIRKELGKNPIFDNSLNDAQEEVDAEIALGIDAPTPKDFSGGYTHERHKRNFLILQKAGVLYQITQDEKYAVYVKDMLLQYEAIYKDLPVHPQTRSYARGKLFWQCLNDANWLVYVSQAYDCVYNYLSQEERNKLENNLFRPFADFISIENPQFYNRVHNHSTWGNAAVGMIGLVMGDEELVQRALYGIENDGLDVDAKDNDGGFIKNKDGKAGFLANLEEPFSPDGYYTEGPYYQRYAMYPFLVFAEGLHNVKPELKIFEYKDSVLLKSVNALINLTDAKGKFFPLNDGQKGMSYYSNSLVTALNIAYHYGGNDPSLLSIAEMQNVVLLDDTGLSVAKGIRNGKAEPFEKKSINLSDGEDGTEGGVGVLRSDGDNMSLVFKYSAQGLSHGHYDKLSFSLYEKGNEVIQDYGLVRFVNIEQKGGGNYLKENNSWAKQTIAHNTITQNEISHFGGKYEVGSKHHSVLYFFDFNNKDVQVISAKETNAYPGTELHRTMAIINDDNFEKPYLLDIMRIASNQNNQYDFPFYYLGQIISTNVDYTISTIFKPLGSRNGYQHLYLEAEGKPNDKNAKLLWLNEGVFYSLTTVTNSDDNILFTRIGANDPDFNLRREPAFMLRRKDAKNTVFATVIESHGSYNPVSEFSVNSNSNISELKVVYDTEDYTAIALKDINSNVSLFLLANTNNSDEAEHQLNVDGRLYKWKSKYKYLRLN